MRLPKLPLFFIFTFLIFSLGFSQEYSLSGRVVNNENAYVEYANVILQKASDSTVISGTSTSKTGSYLLTGLYGETYFVTASFIGKSASSKPFKVSGDITLDDIIITESSESLDEVVVKAAEPNLTQEVDKLVFSVKNTALTESDIWNVLKQTPGLVVINDQLTIQGSGDISVLINNRRVNIPKQDLVNLLTGTSASTLESIEVYSTPPAKYSAEGSGLININLSKPLIAGYNGAAYYTYEQGDLPKHVIGTDHYFRWKNSGLSINYSYQNKSRTTIIQDRISFLDNGAVTSRWFTNQNNKQNGQAHSLSAFYDITANDKHQFDISTIISYRPKLDKFYNSNTSIFNPDGTFNSRFQTSIDIEEPVTNAAFYADHKYSISKNVSLSTSANVTFYDYERGQDLDTDFFDENNTQTGENTFTTFSEQDTKLYSLQSDLSAKLSKTANLETGVKLAYINSDSNILQQGFDTQQDGLMPTENGTFDYDEQIYAGYVSYNNTFGKFTTKAGLRAEYTETEGTSSVLEEPTTNTYFELFPSIALQYKAAKKHRLNLNYFRRITRPRYKTINPFQFFQNNFTVVEGDPNLNPAFLNYVALSYTFDRKLKIQPFYRNRKNLIGQQAFQDNTNNILRFVNYNIDREIGYGVDITYNKRLTTRWSTYAYLLAYQQINRFTDINTNVQLESDIFTGYALWNNSFSLLKDKSLSATLTLLYVAPSNFGNSRDDGYSTTDLSFRKSLFNRKAYLSIKITDIFNEGNRLNERRFLNQDNSTYTNGETRTVSIGFRYLFGNQKIRSNKTSKDTDERKRL